MRFIPYVADCLDDVGLGAAGRGRRRRRPLHQLPRRSPRSCRRTRSRSPGRSGRRSSPRSASRACPPTGSGPAAPSRRSRTPRPGIVDPVRARRRCRRSRTSPPTNSNGTDVAVGADGSLHVVWTAPNGVWYADGPRRLHRGAALRLRLLAEAGRADRQPLGRGRRRREPVGRLHRERLGPGGPRRDAGRRQVDRPTRCSRSRSAPGARSRARRRSPSRRTGRSWRSSTPSSGEVDLARHGRRRLDRRDRRPTARPGRASTSPSTPTATRSLSYFTEENLEVAAWSASGAQWRTASVAPAPAGLADAKGGNCHPDRGRGRRRGRHDLRDLGRRRRRRARLGRRLDLHADRDRASTPAAAPTRRSRSNADGSAVYRRLVRHRDEGPDDGRPGRPRRRSASPSRARPRRPVRSPRRRRGVRRPTGRSPLDIVGPEHRVRSDLPGGAGGRGVHDQLRQQGRRRDDRAAQHRDLDRCRLHAISCSRATWSRARTRSSTTVDALDAGNYFFRCDVHPTMTGQFVVVEARAARSSGGSDRGVTAPLLE